MCVCVCVHIRFHYRNRLSVSICAQCAGKLGKQGSLWPLVLLLPPASPNRVWRQEIRVRPQSEGHVAIVYAPRTSDLSSPPPVTLSHHSHGPQILSPESRLKNKTSWPSPARPGQAQHNRHGALRFLFEPAMKNRWESKEKTGRSRRGEKNDSCKVFSKKNNPERLSNYIYLSCVVLLGRPCGLRDCSMVHFPHYLILDGEQKEEGGFGAQFGVSLGGLWWGGWTLRAKCGEGLWDPEGFMLLIGSRSSKL